MKFNKIKQYRYFLQNVSLELKAWSTHLDFMYRKRFKPKNVIVRLKISFSHFFLVWRKKKNKHVIVSFHYLPWYLYYNHGSSTKIEIRLPNIWACARSQNSLTGFVNMVSFSSSILSELQTEMTLDGNPIDNFGYNGILAPHNCARNTVQSYFKLQIKAFIRFRRIHECKWTEQIWGI